jgi:predicted XRE-type DNA-binding protein
MDGLGMAKVIRHERSSGDVFVDIGFTPAEAAELRAKADLISAIDDTIRRRSLTQVEAARICKTDQPTLSKILRGRIESVTIDRLAGFLAALGRTVEIRIKPFDAKAKTGQLLTVS